MFYMRVSAILTVHIHEFKAHTTTTKSDVHNSTPLQLVEVCSQRNAHMHES